MAVDAREGLFLVPEITGTERFVSDVELTHSQHIMAELSGLLIDTHDLGLSLSELDGDALLFYGLGELPALEALEAQAARWIAGFHTRLDLLKRNIYCDCGVCLHVGELGLRVLGHYGEFGVQSMSSRSTVVGKEAILVRKLLQSAGSVSNSLLLSPQLVARLGRSPTGLEHYRSVPVTVPVFGEVTLACRDYDHARREGAGPDQPVLPRLDAEMTETLDIQCSLESVARTLTDFQGWERWVEGLERLEVDHTAPLRSGQRQICVAGGRRYDQIVERIVRDNDEFTLVMRSGNPGPHLNRLLFTFQAQRMGTGVRLQQTLAYSHHPLLGWVFRLTGKEKLRSQAHQSLQNLKARLEASA